MFSALGHLLATFSYCSKIRVWAAPHRLHFQSLRVLKWKFKVWVQATTLFPDCLRNSQGFVSNWLRFVSLQAELSSVQTVMVNCMSLRSSHAVFPLLADKLKASGGQNGLQRFLTAPGPTVWVNKSSSYIYLKKEVYDRWLKGVAF